MNILKLFVGLLALVSAVDASRWELLLVIIPALGVVILAGDD